MAGRDLIACAQTGTGKTAAFCLPIAERFLREPAVDALVLAPTRELALQIQAFWRDLTRHAPQLRSACLIGGAGFHPQVQALRARPRLIIATPGRLLDHLQQRTCSLSGIEILVLDEGDRMLDMGFAPQLDRIRRKLPQRARQTMLFSATWDSSLDNLAKTYLRNPERIEVGTTSRAASTVDQRLISTLAPRKNETLLDILKQCREGSVLVFARTQHRTDRLAKFLNSKGLDVGRIHGGRSQGQRVSALTSFREGRTRILVATDIAARGLDVSQIAWVINYDLPRAAEDYVHRIGRTGRAGVRGEAISIMTPDDRAQWNDIARLLKKTGSAVPVARSHEEITRGSTSSWKISDNSEMVVQRGA